MPAWFGTTLTMRRRGGTEAIASNAVPSSPRETSGLPGLSTARALACALDEAMAHERWGLAERLAQAAARMPLDVRRAAGLCEREARLRAARGDASTAINIIDATGQCSSSMRLLRAMCLVQAGRRDEAHLELRQWAQRSSSPLVARLMLALLEWHDGDMTAACDALRMNLRQFEDPATLAALMLMHEARGHTQQADRWAARLRTACAFSPEAPIYDRMLRSIGREPIDSAEPGPTDAHIETLALELIAGEAAIPALVDAQQQKPQQAIGEVLCAALERALPDLDDRATAYLAIADLKALHGDVRAALDWAERGVKEYPMSAALVRRRIELRSAFAEAYETSVVERAA